MKRKSTIATPPKVIKIRIEYDNGHIMGADGNDAEKVMQWWHTCEIMHGIHGGRFGGKPLKLINKQTAYKKPKRPQKMKLDSDLNGHSWL